MEKLSKVRERPFDFYGGGGGGRGAGRFFEKKNQGQNFARKKYRVNSIVHIVLYTNKKTGWHRM